MTIISLSCTEPDCSWAGKNQLELKGHHVRVHQIQQYRCLVCGRGKRSYKKMYSEILPLKLFFFKLFIFNTFSSPQISPESPPGTSSPGGRLPVLPLRPVVPPARSPHSPLRPPAPARPVPLSSRRLWSAVYHQAGGKRPPTILWPGGPRHWTTAAAAAARAAEAKDE